MLRMIYQPLTEKTEIKPVDGEILVNTENGHINVYNNGKLKSATKDIEENITFLNIELEELLEEYSNIINDEVFTNSGLVSLYEESINILNYATTIETKIGTNLDDTAFQTQLTKLKSDYNSIITLKEDNYFLINYFRTVIKDIKEIESLLDEIQYIKNIVTKLRNQLNDLIDSLNFLFNKVEKNIDTRVSEEEYNIYMETLKNKYLNLKTRFDEIQTISINRWDGI